MGIEEAYRSSAPGESDDQADGRPEAPDDPTITTLIVPHGVATRIDQPGHCGLL